MRHFLLLSLQEVAFIDQLLSMDLVTEAAGMFPCVFCGISCTSSWWSCWDRFRRYLTRWLGRGNSLIWNKEGLPWWFSPWRCCPGTAWRGVLGNWSLPMNVCMTYVHRLLMGVHLLVKLNDLVELTTNVLQTNLGMIDTFSHSTLLLPYDLNDFSITQFIAMEVDLFDLFLS